MKLIKMRIVNGQVYESEVCKVPDTLFSSMRGLRMFLETHASRELGLNARIKQTQPGCLVPIYAVDPATGDTLEIA